MFITPAFAQGSLFGGAGGEGGMLVSLLPFALATMAVAVVLSQLFRPMRVDHLLGLLHGGKQRQIALDQELGLARAGWCLNDERAAWIERGGASSVVAHPFTSSR